MIGIKTYVPQLFRNMRIARYSNDLAVFKKNYIELVSIPNSNYTQESLCAYWLPIIFNLEKVEALPIDIRGYLLMDKLILALYELKKVDGYFYYVKDKLEAFSKGQQEYLAIILAQFFLLRGEWAEIEKVTNYLEEIIAGGILGMHQFITGAHKEALATFDVTQKILRKTNRNNHLRLEGLEGVLHNLARLKVQNPTLDKKIDSHITWAIKEEGDFKSAFYWLRAVRLYLKNEKGAALDLMKSNSSADNLVNFFKPFCHFWIDASKVDDRTVKQLYNLTKENGYQWMATELLALQNALIPDNPGREALLEQQLKNGSAINVMLSFQDYNGK